MDETEEEREEVVDMYRLLREKVFLPEQVVDGRHKNGKRYEKLDQFCVDRNERHRCQRQGDGMTEGECRHQDKNFFPVAGYVDSTEGHYKQNVIIAVRIVEDVVFAQNEVEGEL